MKAAVQREYGAPEEVVTLEDVPLPDLDDDEVLIQVRAAGVNWADWSMTRGMPYLMRAGYGLRRPRNGIRGTDVAGVVEAAGAAVDDFERGDAVFGWCTKAFAEHAAVKAAQLIAKPERLTFEQAAGIPMAGCVALQAMRDVGKVEPGGTVLVNGASGGIGTFAVQVAKSRGAEVTGVCSTANLDLVASLGADYVIDYTKDDYTTLGRQYDVILDIADNHTLGERRAVLTREGTLIPNSGEGGPVFGSLGRIAKAWLATPFVSQRYRAFLSLATQDDLLELRDLIESGDLTPVIGATYPLADAGAAIRQAGSGHAVGKVIITI